VFLMVFSAIVFFAPEMGGYFLEYNNFIPADPFQTPLHIALPLTGRLADLKAGDLVHFVYQPSQAWCFAA